MWFSWTVLLVTGSHCESYLWLPSPGGLIMEQDKTPVSCCSVGTQNLLALTSVCFPSLPIPALLLHVSPNLLEWKCSSSKEWKYCSPLKGIRLVAVPQGPCCTRVHSTFLLWHPWHMCFHKCWMLETGQAKWFVRVTLRKYRKGPLRWQTLLFITLRFAHFVLQVIY